MSEEALEDQRQAKVDAQRFLQDPTTLRVLARVMRHYQKALEESAPEEKELREDCYHQLRAVKEFERQLTKLAGSGRLEAVRREAARGGVSPAA